MRFTRAQQLTIAVLVLASASASASASNPALRSLTTDPNAVWEKVATPSSPSPAPALTSSPPPPAFWATASGHVHGEWTRFVAWIKSWWPKATQHEVVDALHQLQTDSTVTIDQLQDAVAKVWADESAVDKSGAVVDAIAKLLQSGSQSGSAQDDVAGTSSSSSASDSGVDYYYYVGDAKGTTSYTTAAQYAPVSLSSSSSSSAAVGAVVAAAAVADSDDAFVDSVSKKL